MDAIQIQQEQILDPQVHQQLLGLAGELFPQGVTAAQY